MFDVSKITSLQILPERFTQNRPGYKPNDKGMTSVHCHV